MRPLELILCVVIIITAAMYLLPIAPERMKFRWLPALSLLILLLQVWLEGFRWQLWPVVLAVVLLLFPAAVRLKRKGTQRKPLGAALGGILLVGLSLGLGWVLPIPEPYLTTGPFEVGTTVFPLVDETRMEMYGSDPEANREVMVQVWYPASPSEDSQRAYFMPDIQYAGPALAEWIEIPTFALNHLEYALANAYLDAPVLAEGGPFPVLVFSHGWSGFREQNIYQVEELASHGYVVVGISHTYGAVLTVFPDGRQLPRDDAALPDDVTEEEYDLAANRLVRQWAGDIGFVLDELAQWSEDGEWFLAGRLDFDRVGVFGHSTGGGATAEFCSTDLRCKAALTMDLWAEPVSDSVISDGLWQPFLLMYSEVWANLEKPSDNFRRLGDLIISSNGEVTEIRIEGTFHHDFSAIPLLTPLASQLGLKGSIEGDRGLALINYYTLAFFDYALKAGDAGLLDPANAPFAEAQFVLRP